MTPPAGGGRSRGDGTQGGDGDQVAEGSAAADAVAAAARRTTSRRELAQHPSFAALSPEVGELDEDALDDLLAQDTDEAVTLLALLAGATDVRLRALARAAAGRITVELARGVGPSRPGVARLQRRPLTRTAGDLDLDASLEPIAAARAAGVAPDPAELVVASWTRPDTALCLVVDRSGSMHGTRLATAAVAAAAVALRAPRDASVLAFAGDTVVLSSQSDGREPDSVVDDLLTLRGAGVTDLALALRCADDQLARSRAGRRVAVVLSDCRATTGANPLDVAVSLGAVDELVVLAPADDADDARSFAAASGARLVEVSGPSDVARALAEALEPTP